MPATAPTYDLVLILDPEAAEDARAKIVSDARRAIEAGGELTRQDAWGERPLAYPIEHRKSGEYHLLQFHSGGGELLNGLGRTLKIADEVLRFRIVKLRPGVPEAPDMRHSAPPPRRAEGEQPQAEAATPPEAAAPAEAAAAAEAGPPAEPPAAPAAPEPQAATDPAEPPAAEAGAEPATDAAGSDEDGDGEASQAAAGDA
jgi:small subunit ribosomal protein S6